MPYQDNNTIFTPYLDEAINSIASDIHFVVGLPPMLRINGTIHPLNHAPLSNDDNEEIIGGLLGDKNLRPVIEQTRKELDFSFPYKGHQFRCNVYFERGHISAALRLLPNKIKSFEDLGIPPIVEKFTNYSQGLVVVTGPTGHGKSTTLAAMVEKINTTRETHIITIEDPIEYIFEHKKSIITQREVGRDTPSFASALRASVREDPNILLVGEMRDLETVESVLSLAETGHLVLTTLHTNSAGQSPDRIINMFPERQRDQVKTQLAEVLVGIISQRLIPRAGGGRILATEILVANHAVKSIIREGKTHQLSNTIQTSVAEGMIHIDKVLADLVSRGEINIKDALNWAEDSKGLSMLVY